jgi:hypothetical protein
MMQRFEMQTKDRLGTKLPQKSFARALTFPLLLMCP